MQLIVWFQNFLKKEKYSVFLKREGQKTEALNVEAKNKTALFQEKYFVLAVKTKAIKMTKEVASSSHTNVRKNLQSENSASQWFNNYKNPSCHYYSQFIFWWNVSFVVVLHPCPPATVVCHII